MRTWFYSHFQDPVEETPAEKRKHRADETRERRIQLTTLFMSGLKPRPPEELHAGVGLAADELAGAGAADEFSGVVHGFAARKNSFRRAGGVNALEHRVVNAHVMRFRADDFLAVRVKDHEVSIRADGDCPLPRVQSKKFCERGGNKLDEAVGRKAFSVDAAGVNQPLRRQKRRWHQSGVEPSRRRERAQFTETEEKADPSPHGGSLRASGQAG